MKTHAAPIGPASLLTRRDPTWARDFEAILKAYEAAGGKVDALQSDRIASAVISANRVLFVNEIPGIHLEAEETPTGIRAHIRVDPGTRVEYPVHLCFGMIPQEGVQEILPTFEIGEGAEVGFLAHCTFPNAVNLQHIMDATVRIGPGATMRYTEAHYHGPYGGIQVLPTSHVIVEEEGRFENEFNLTHGRIGRMEIRMEVDVAARGVAELVVKAYGMGDDYIRVEETIRLNGPEARG